MKRLIYLEDAIDALEREKIYSSAYKYSYTQTDYFKQYNMGLTDGIKALNKLPSAQPEPPEDICGECDAWNKYKSEIKALPSVEELKSEAWDTAYLEGYTAGQNAQPKYVALHESCTDCPLYDRKNYNCPRFNRVIPMAIRDAQTQVKALSLPSAQPEHTETHSCDYQRTETHGWIPVTEALPEDIRPVVVTWKNNDPESYYQYIVGKHFIGVAHFKGGKWYWYSSTTEDFLAEYGRYDGEEFDEAIEVVAWCELPEPYKEEQDGTRD